MRKLNFDIRAQERIERNAAIYNLRKRYAHKAKTPMQRVCEYIAHVMCVAIW